jgi:hypothetical protein
MKKTNLKLYELQQLNIDLNGSENAKGLLNEKLKLITKYWLNDLNNKIITEIGLIDKIKNELIQKYGVQQDNGTVIIEQKINDEINPNFIEFMTEFNILLNEEKEIEHYEFKLSDIDIESDINIQILFKLITNE